VVNYTFTSVLTYTKPILKTDHHFVIADTITNKPQYTANLAHGITALYLYLPVYRHSQGVATQYQVAVFIVLVTLILVALVQNLMLY